MATIALLDERQLLTEVAAGNEAAYKRLFVHYWDQIYSTALLFTKSRELSQDLAQDIFAKVWIRREKLREIERFDAFLFIIARNVIIDRLRKKVFNTTNETYLMEYFADTSLAPSDKMEIKEMEAIIRRAIDVLPVQQRTAFCLSRFQGLKHEEIAVRMGISKDSVKSYIVRALVHLRKFLAEHSEAIPLLGLLLLFL
ncbi:MAG TPA: RNA polymerase sigma-70 factor [Puia sp.]|nr:RNA polymerase sigma-70 factor [Puia sp.]